MLSVFWYVLELQLGKIRQDYLEGSLIKKIATHVFILMILICSCMDKNKKENIGKE